MCASTKTMTSDYPPSNNIFLSHQMALNIEIMVMFIKINKLKTIQCSLKTYNYAYYFDVIYSRQQ